MKNTGKILTLICAFALVAVLAVGGTMAYLTAGTEAVTNTFTVGKIEATLDEIDADNSTATAARDTANRYKIIPGVQLDKDPTVHVKAGSEKCYVYVCIQDDLNETVTGAAKYTVDPAKWELLDGTANIYKYITVVDAANADVDLLVFDGVSIDGDVVTAGNIDSLSGKTIVVSAYLHQAENLSDGISVDSLAAAHFNPMPAAED